MGTAFNTSGRRCLFTTNMEQTTRDQCNQANINKRTLQAGVGGPTHAEAGKRATQGDLVLNICTGVTGVVFVVDDEQNHTQEEADGAHGHVGDAREGVLPSHPGDGAEDHPFATVEAEHRVI